MSVISEQVFDDLMRPFDLRAGMTIAVATSGGSDSMCLNFLLSRWAKKHHVAICPVIVDHGLRAESALEALQTTKRLAALGLTATTLCWQGEKPTTRIEEIARQKRYELLFSFCADHHIRHLFLAHQSADLAETFLSRLSHASGLDGLVPMTVQTRQKAVVLCRPLLGVQKADIMQTLAHYQIAWAHDTMNDDLHYERVRWRALLPGLADNGLTATALHKTIKRLQGAKEALTFYRDMFLKTYTLICPQGFAFFPFVAYRQLPKDMQVRVLQELVRIIGQSPHPVSLEHIERKTATLTGPVGASVVCIKGEKVYVCKEKKAQEAPLSVQAHQWYLWDRFAVFSPVAGTFSGGVGREADTKKYPHCVRDVWPTFADTTGKIWPVSFTSACKEKGPVAVFLSDKDDFTAQFDL